MNVSVRIKKPLAGAPDGRLNYKSFAVRIKKPPAGAPDGRSNL